MVLFLMPSVPSVASSEICGLTCVKKFPFQHKLAMDVGFSQDHIVKQSWASHLFPIPLIWPRSKFKGNAGYCATIHLMGLNGELFPGYATTIQEMERSWQSSHTQRGQDISCGMEYSCKRVCLLTSEIHHGLPCLSDNLLRLLLPSVAFIWHNVCSWDPMGDLLGAGAPMFSGIWEMLLALVAYRSVLV